MSSYQLHDYVYVLRNNSLIYEGTIIAVDSKHLIVLTTKSNFKLVIGLYDGYYTVIKGINAKINIDKRSARVR